jgi:hypothetical protein
MQGYTSSVSTKIEVTTGDSKSFKGDLIVIPFYKPQLPMSGAQIY